MNKKIIGKYIGNGMLDLSAYAIEKYLSNAYDGELILEEGLVKIVNDEKKYVRSMWEKCIADIKEN